MAQTPLEFDNDLGILTPTAMTDVDEGNIQKLGLSNPIQMNMIDQLRDVGVQQYIALPQLVVVGDQSSGKSSVLEAIMEIPLPRSSGLCTRFATMITFRRHPKTNVDISIIPGDKCDPSRSKALKAFKRDGLTSLDGQMFLSILEDASKAMGVIGPNDVLRPGMKTFSDDVFKIELSGPDRENLSIIDIPGIFRNPTPGITTETDIALVKNMVRHYIKDRRTIILAVVPANVDIATQEILRMAEEVDPKGQRTVGVLTKPDIVDKGGEPNVIELVNGNSSKLALGYYVVRNRGQNELNSSTADRAEKERQFFATEPWDQLNQERVGIYALKSRLQTLLADIIKREFPNIRSQIDKRLGECKKAVELMGPDRETVEDQKRYLECIMGNFQDIRKDVMNRTYHRHTCLMEGSTLRLPTLVADRCDIFQDDIQHKGHAVEFEPKPIASERGNFVNEPLERNANAEHIQLMHPRDGDFDSKSPSPFADEDDCESVAVVKGDEKPTFPELESLLVPSESTEWPNMQNMRSWIKAEYTKARGYGLDIMDPNILPLLWQKQSQNWVHITRQFINDIIRSVHEFIYYLLGEVCPDDRTRDSLFSFILDDLLAKYKCAADQVDFILDVERHGSCHTRNHYFGDTLLKIRTARQQDEVKKLSVGAFLDQDYETQSIPMVRISDLSKTFTSKANIDHAVDDMHSVLTVYYKVTRKRFVDTVIGQAVDHFLLTSKESPLAILTPSFVFDLKPEDLKSITGEEKTSRDKREALKKEIVALEQGKRVLSGRI